MKEISSLIIFVGLFLRINGRHFLGGTITWRPLNESATGTPVAIVITQTYSWTYAHMPCTDTMIATNQFVTAFGSVPVQNLTCIADCGATSLGYTDIGVLPYCTDFSTPVNTTVGQRSDIVYLVAGDNFSVAYQGSAWRSLATGSGAPWSISSRIKIEPRSDNGLYNNAPVATVMSPINIPVNKTKIIHIPIADADGDTLRCRWSTNSSGVDECGGVCPPDSLPPNTVIFPNCTIIITGENPGDWFGVALMVEDFINSTSTTPLSSVPVQFLVYVANETICGFPPEIIGIPREQSCTPVLPGQLYTTELIAINNCGPTVTIIDIATLSFPGMIKSNITSLNSTHYSKTLTWTPTTAQLGYQVMCAMAFDSEGAQSSQYCFKFYVTETMVLSCPGETSTTTSTSTTTVTSTSTSTTTGTTSTSTSTTTSTSSTSSTSSTTSTTTTTTTSTPKPSDPINWILIGSLISLLSLACLTLCLCLCCRFFCFGSPRSYICEREGSIELYHIERCIDPDCIRPNPKESSLIPQKRYLGNGELPDSGNEWDMVILAGDLSASTMKIRIRRHSMSGASVTRIVDTEDTSNVGNRIVDEVITNQIPMKNLKKRGNIQITRVKYAEKPRPNSIDTGLYGNSVNDTQSVRIARVTSFLAKIPMIDPSNEERCSSIDRSSTHFVETHKRLHLSRNINKNQVTVIRVPFAHHKKESKKHFLLPDDATHSSFGGSSSALPILSHSRKHRRILTSLT